MAEAFTLFETAIGPCGIGWSERGIVGIQLPEGSPAATRARLRKRFPTAREEAPPPAVRKSVEAIGSLLQGREGNHLSTAILDMRGVPTFHRQVYEIARSVPPGSTLSYGEIARRLGNPGAARAVGQALGRNPFPLIIPCHRVLAAGGRVGGYSANGGIATKLRLLALEEPPLSDGEAGAFEGDGRFGFDPEAALAHLRRVDPGLGHQIDRTGPFRMRLERTPSIFLALAEAIVYQQLTGRAAATIYARVRALFPRAQQGLTPGQILRVSEAKLRGAGLSRSKLLSIRDLARRAADGQLPTLAEIHRMEDEAIIERLTEVRGIGRWTVEMLLMFRLGRPDVLPVDDYGVRKGFAAAFRKRTMPSPRDVARHGARWKPYRTVASWYLWRAAEKARGPEPAP